jgi:hypothetical protein
VSNEVVEDALILSANGGMIEIPARAENETKLESTVTVALVERVAERVAHGNPLKLALAGEPVSREEYEEYLRQRPNLAALADVAKRRYLNQAVGLLLNAKDPSSNVRWLLERFYPEIFSREREREPDNVQVNVTTVAGMSQDELTRFQEGAKLL